MNLRRAVIGALLGALCISGAYAVASNYTRSLANVLVSEGGYSNHPSDPGGPTNWGITIHDVRKYINADATAADVRNLTLEQAGIVYRAHYWDHPCMRGDALPAGLDYSVFDYGVNSGVGRAGKVLRRVLKLSDAVCAIDAQVLGALKARDKFDLIKSVNAERMRFLRGLRTWPVFGGGWSRRVASVNLISLRMAQPSGARFGLPEPAYGPGKAYENDAPGDGEQP